MHPCRWVANFIAFWFIFLCLRFKKVNRYICFISSSFLHKRPHSKFLPFAFLNLELYPGNHSFQCKTSSSLFLQLYNATLCVSLLNQSLLFGHLVVFSFTITDIAAVNKLIHVHVHTHVCTHTHTHFLTAWGIYLQGIFSEVRLLDGKVNVYVICYLLHCQIPLHKIFTILHLHQQ